MSRKVLSVGVAHMAIIQFWLSGMLFHTAYFSNYAGWLCDPLHVKPSAQVVASIVGQDILNSDVGSAFHGIYITSGLFHVWRSQGMLTYTSLKYASLVSFLASCVLLVLSYFIMHILPIAQSPRYFAIKHLTTIAGLASIAWSGHLVHISYPVSILLSSGVDQYSLPCAHDYLSYKLFHTLVTTDFLSINSIYTSILNPIESSGALSAQLVIIHHVFVGVALLLAGISLAIKDTVRPSRKAVVSAFQPAHWHIRLAAALLVLSTLCFVVSYSLLLSPAYPFLGADYASIVSLYTHHCWIGGFLLIGASSHGSIFLVSEFCFSSTRQSFLMALLAHRDSLVSHITWVSIFLGMHAFGIYVHNDTLQALGRPSDTFSDASIQLRPFFGTLLGLATSDHSAQSYVGLRSIGTLVIYQHQYLGTSDFLVQHIHSFTLHTTALVLIKGLLYSRSSRLVSDKFKLGFRFPCDGPGRGGTCQLSSWDHIFLAIFWMYNSLSIILFNFFWKYQSDVWGSLLESPRGTLLVSHVSSGDFACNASSINGWLRNLLWSQSSPVIQAYSTTAAAYGYLFISSHLLWAFSLMFLYSGRGYWQELIESIVWAHTKLLVIPSIQPRALSISQGRAVGISHYILGGIGCTWSFFISRSISFG